MAVVETVKIVSKNGYIIINKSDLKIYEEKKEEEKKEEEKPYKSKRTKREKYDD